ncbi:hypothetical protein ACHAWF_010975 [Thalassiosira exigua]
MTFIKQAPFILLAIVSASEEVSLALGADVPESAVQATPAGSPLSKHVPILHSWPSQVLPAVQAKGAEAIDTSTKGMNLIDARALTFPTERSTLPTISTLPAGTAFASRTPFKAQSTFTARQTAPQSANSQANQAPQAQSSANSAKAHEAPYSLAYSLRWQVYPQSSQLAGRRCVRDRTPRIRRGGQRYRFDLVKSNAQCVDRRDRRYEYGQFRRVRNFEDCADKCVKDVSRSLLDNFRGIDYDCDSSTCQCLYDSGTLSSRSSNSFDRTNRNNRGTGPIDGTKRKRGFYCGELVESDAIDEADVAEGSDTEKAIGVATAAEEDIEEVASSDSFEAVVTEEVIEEGEERRCYCCRVET